MARDAPDAPTTLTARLAIKTPCGPLHAALTVPAGPVPLVQLLPAARDLSSALTQVAVDAVEAQGEHVSCCKGCGACCRQLVPISTVEARMLRDLVAGLPEPRRSIVRARFAEARAAVERTGLLDALQHPESCNDDLVAVGLKYFQLGMPCPFLEDESCSIHPDRPLTCREYLVTSPSEHCARPSAADVRRVPLPTSIWRALARVAEATAPEAPPTWVPLILALEWADAHPDESGPRPGPDWLRDLIGNVARGEVPPPVTPAPG